MSELHEVSIMCNCTGGVEHCALERYIADVRIAFEEIERLTLLAVNEGRTVEMVAASGIAA